MKVQLFILAMIALLSCNTNTKKLVSDSLANKSNSLKIRDSIKKQQALNTQMALGDRPENEELPPSKNEEREKISKSYNDIKYIDTLLILGNDSLKIHTKYYCLKDSEIVVPKQYDLESKPPSVFVTHPFVADICLTKNGNIVLNKTFKISEFNPFFEDNFGGNLKKYGSLLQLNLLNKKQKISQVVFDFSISIPSTDIGIEMFLIISKDGKYKIAENYN